jgi:primosomal protein N' (replication factor Y) (superfamily II helicase)
MQKWLDVAVSAPAHSQVGGLLTYVTELPASVGQLVRVPFGNREVLVWCGGFTPLRHSH